MIRQEIVSALNAKYDREFEKYGNIRRGLAGLTSVHLDLLLDAAGTQSLFTASVCRGLLLTI